MCTRYSYNSANTFDLFNNKTTMSAEQNTVTKKVSAIKNSERCMHITLEGERCKLKKLDDTEYCHVHADKPKSVLSKKNSPTKDVDAEKPKKKSPAKDVEEDKPKKKSPTKDVEEDKPKKKVPATKSSDAPKEKVKKAPTKDKQ